jgi:hypothetical protein
LTASVGPPTAGGKGYQVRLYNQIIGLASRHAITLVTFVRAGETIDAEIAAACGRVVTIPLSAAAAATSAVLRAARLPLSVGLYSSSRMHHAMTAELRRGCDLVQLQLVRMAPYMRQAARTPVVLDLLDAAELNMRERARASNPVVRPALAIEARRLGTYEKRAIAAANLSLLISQRDFECVGSPANARILPNGIEPKAGGIHSPRQAATLIFSGTMSYFPNADAATWFAREIMPLVRRSLPDTQFRIVGREPPAAVRNLASLPGVTVTGAIADMATEISRAAVSVCPMRFGSGMQTKILEAMATETPVVATSKALEGLPVDLHRFAGQADTPETFAECVVRILQAPDRAQKAAADALKVIRRQHTWRHMVDQLELLYEEAIARPPTNPIR